MHALSPSAILGLILATGCATPSGGAVKSVPVAINLYVYPMDDLIRLPALRNAGDLDKIRSWKNRYSKTVDLKEGLPIREFSPQYEKTADLVDQVAAAGTSHVWNDDFLDCLPHQFYNRVGWIDWHLVKRDRAGKVIRIVSQKGLHLSGEPTLLKDARAGDEIAGLWGF